MAVQSGRYLLRHELGGLRSDAVSIVDAGFSSRAPSWCRNFSYLENSAPSANMATRHRLLKGRRAVATSNGTPSPWRLPAPRPLPESFGGPDNGMDLGHQDNLRSQAREAEEGRLPPLGCGLTQGTRCRNPVNLGDVPRRPPWVGPMTARRVASCASQLAPP